MTFKEIKKGFTVYILHKGEDGVKATQGKVIDVIGPHIPPSSMPNGQFTASQLTMMQQMVVDIVVEENGAKTSYSIPESLSVTYADNIVISTDREGIVREAQAMFNHSDEIIKAVPLHEKIKKDCTAILESWDNSFKERRENEVRFKKLEDNVNQRIGGIESKLDLLLKKLE